MNYTILYILVSTFITTIFLHITAKHFIIRLYSKARGFYGSTRRFINKQYDLNFSKEILDDKFTHFQGAFIRTKDLKEGDYIINGDIILHNFNLNKFDDEVKMLSLYLLYNISFLQVLTLDEDLKEQALITFKEQFTYNTPEDSNLYLKSILNAHIKDNIEKKDNLDTISKKHDDNYKTGKDIKNKHNTNNNLK